DAGGRRRGLGACISGVAIVVNRSPLLTPPLAADACQKRDRKADTAPLVSERAGAQRREQGRSVTLAIDYDRSARNLGAKKQWQWLAGRRPSKNARAGWPEARLSGPVGVERGGGERGGKKAKRKKHHPRAAAAISRSRRRVERATHTA